MDDFTVEDEYYDDSVKTPKKSKISKVESRSKRGKRNKEKEWLAELKKPRDDLLCDDLKVRIYCFLKFLI